MKWSAEPFVSFRFVRTDFQNQCKILYRFLRIFFRSFRCFTNQFGRKKWEEKKKNSIRTKTEKMNENWWIQLIHHISLRFSLFAFTQVLLNCELVPYTKYLIVFPVTTQTVMIDGQNPAQLKRIHWLSLSPLISTFFNWSISVNDVIYKKFRKKKRKNDELKKNKESTRKGPRYIWFSQHIINKFPNRFRYIINTHNVEIIILFFTPKTK